MKSFGETIRSLRKDKKLPLQAVAESLGIDLAILSKIERGQRKASRNLVLKMSSFYQVDKDHLMISWLSDKLADELIEEDTALEALKVAEDKVVYGRRNVMDRGQIINALHDFFRNDGRVSKAWIFGSFARGEVLSNHDIDLMVEYSDKASGTLLDYADIRYRLENMLNQRIDLVEVGFVQPFASESIDRDKILIYG